MEQNSIANGRVVKAPPLMASSSRAKASSVAEPEPSQQQDEVEMAERASTPSTIDGGEDPIDVDQPETTPAERTGVLKSPKSPKSPKLGTMADSTSNMDANEEEEDVPSDPNLLVSYPIYLNTSLPSTSSLHLLQYPTYPRRSPLPLPVTAAERGIKQAIRWRPRAGWVQVELPLDMRAGVYTEEKATELGRGAAMKGGEIGIKSDIKPEPTSSDEDDGWGGTTKKSKHGSSSSSSRKGKGKARDMEDGTAQMPKKLEKIRLESDVMPNLTTYCVGVMKGKALHLTQLDRIVQLRPSMHYLDGLDAIEADSKRAAKSAQEAGQEGEETDGEEKKEAPAKKAQSFSVSIKGNPGAMGPGGPGGQGTGPPTSDRDVLMASRRRAEGEVWVDLDWRGYADPRWKAEVQRKAEEQLYAQGTTRLKCQTKPREYLP